LALRHPVEAIRPHIHFSKNRLLGSINCLHLCFIILYRQLRKTAIKLYFWLVFWDLVKKFVPNAQVFCEEREKNE